MIVVDRVGKRYGRLVVLSRSGQARSGHIMWLCQCDCGRQKEVSGNNLQSRNTSSCGCLLSENYYGRVKND